MRWFALLSLLVVVLPGTARAFDDPKALLDAVYAPYLAGKAPERPESFYSTRLQGLVAANLEQQATAPSGEPANPDAPNALTFDPFIEGQHSLLLDLAIAAPVIQGDRAVAVVSFHNFDHASLLSIAMVREADGWKVDDIAALGAGENWLLSWLLQYDPFDVK